MLGSVSSKRGTSGRATLSWPSSGGDISRLGACRGTSQQGFSGRGLLVKGSSRKTSGKDTDSSSGVTDTSGVGIGMSEENLLSFPAVNEQSASRLHGGPSVRGVDSGMAAAPVDVAGSPFSWVGLMTSLVV